MTKKYNLPKAFFIAGLILAIFTLDNVCHAQNKSNAKSEPVKVTKDFTRYYQSKNPPEIFPDIAFKNALGRDVQISDLKGQWVLVNLWASWCPPCIQEMPSLELLQDRYTNHNFRVVAISLDRAMNVEKLRNVMNRHQFGPVAAYYGDWPIIKAQVDIPGLPTSYLLDPNGDMIGKIVAPMDWESPQVIAFMDELLTAKSKE